MVQAAYFRKIYDATYDKVLSYVLAKCGKIDVEDIVQETYAELFEVLVKKGTEYIHCPEAFVMQLVKTKVHRYYSEKEYQRAWVFVDDPEVFELDTVVGIGDTLLNTEWEEVLIDKLTVQEVMEYISEKEELTKEIFYQHYFEGKKLKKIAESCGVTESAVKNRLYRMLKELSGIKKLLCIIAILILMAFLVKPVYTLAEEVISRVRMFFEEELLTRTPFSAEERKNREIEYIQTSVDEFLDEIEWESKDMEEDTKQKMLEMLEMED